MSRQIVQSANAPKPIGPYSQGVITEGRLLYSAGQTGVDPSLGKLVEGGIEAQTEQTLKNLRSVVEAAGSSMDKVIKTTVYLQNMSDFAAMNGVYATFFPNNPPARTTIAVAALPGGALVEIEVVSSL